MRKLAIFLTLTVLVVGLGSAAVTSVDKISFRSNSDFFSGEVFAISMTSDFSTDRISVTLSSSELSAAADGETDQSLSIDVTSQETFAEFPTRQDSGFAPIAPLDLVRHRSDTKSQRNSWAENNCYDIEQDGSVEYYYASITELDYTNDPSPFYDYLTYCSVVSGQLGQVGKFSSANKIFRTEWKVDASGKPTQTAIVTNGDGGAGARTRIGEHVIVDWEGNLGTGDGPPSIGDSLVMQKGNEFRIIKEPRYQDWQQYVENKLFDKYEKFAAYDRDSTKDRDTVDQEVESTLEQKREEAEQVFSDSQLFGGTFSGSSFEDAQLKVDLEQSIAYPSFTIYVDGAEYVTVEKPTGTPRIVDVSGDRFGEFDRGSISATVKNVGEAEGSFSARVTGCGSHFSAAGTEITRTLDPGETTTYTFEVSFSGDSEVTEQCSIEVTNQVGSSVSKSVSLTGVPDNQCKPGSRIPKILDGRHVIFECGKDGQELRRIETCGEKERAARVNGKLQCVANDRLEVCGNNEDDDGDGKTDENCGGVTGGFLSDILQPFRQFGQDIQSAVANPLNRIFLLVDLVVSVLAGLVAFGFGRTTVANFAAVQNPRHRLVLGAVLGLLVGGLAYSLISSIFVKILVVVGVGAHLYLQTLIPDLTDLV